jgi:hypothetical protein
MKSNKCLKNSTVPSPSTRTNDVADVSLDRHLIADGEMMLSALRQRVGVKRSCGRIASGKVATWLGFAPDLIR